MMKKLLVVSLLANPSLYAAEAKTLAAEQELVPPFATHTMMFSIDSSEKQENSLGPITDAFITGLMQKTGPILVAAPIVQNLATIPDLEELVTYSKNTADNQQYLEMKKYYDAVMAHIKGAVTPDKALKEIQGLEIPAVVKESQSKKSIPDKLIKNALIKETVQNQLVLKDWYIAAINDYLFLFIPHDYIQKKVQQNKIKASSAEYTERELALGLKIDHFKQLPLNTLSDVKGYFEPPAIEFDVPSSTNEAEWESFLANLEKPTQKPLVSMEPNLPLESIFITNKEYKAVIGSSSLENFVDMIPQWAFIADGHGSLAKKTIAGLPISEFKAKILDFIANNLVTKLLIYISCYAAGTNEQLLLTDTTSGVARTYSFTIVSFALTQAPVFAASNYIVMKDFTLEDIDFQKRSPKMISPFHFKDFFEDITTRPVFSVDSLSKIKLSESEFGKVYSMARIRFPYLSWFTIAEARAVVQIGELLALTRDDNQPLNIKTYFKNNNPSAILVYSPVIPFELIIDTDADFAPPIIPMLSEGLRYKFSKITSHKFHADSSRFPSDSLFLKTIESRQFAQGAPSNLFWIDTISTFDTHEGKTVETKLEDVALVLLPDGSFVAKFASDGVEFVTGPLFPPQARERTLEYKKEYLAKIDQDPRIKAFQEKRAQFKKIGESLLKKEEARKKIGGATAAKSRPKKNAVVHRKGRGKERHKVA